MKNQEKVGANYQISIVSKHLQITDAIRNYVLEKLSKVDRVADQIIDVVVTLDTQKLHHVCSILMNFIHFHIKVSADTDNLYSAIDKASDRIVRLVRKYKEKLQSHRMKDLSSVDIHVNVIAPLHDEVKQINDDIEAENAALEAKRYAMHRVVASDKMSIKTLTQDEAIMKMEISDVPFLIYRSEEDRKIKVIYRREDENYGLVAVDA